MTDSSGDRNPVELLAEEFIERKRRGEKPTLSEYTDKYPDLAADIRDLFPALLLMEDLGEITPNRTGPYIGGGLTVRQLGDYRILREVGRGGMGVVFEAEQLSLGRRVALKVLPSHILKDDQQMRRFEREARAAARLHHTNIVPVFGVGSHEGTHFYVMQFIQGLGLDGVLQELRLLRAGKAKPSAQAVEAQGGRSAVQQVAHSLVTGIFQEKALSSAPKNEAAPSKESGSVSDTSVPRLPEGSDLSSVSGSDARYWRSVARIGVQVAGALEHAHSQGILHRDIKPSNLLMDMKGTVWVTDFGLAKAGEEDALTETGDIVGTLRYMAPERFRTPGDARSDVYSLGLTLYEMLALRPAFNQRERPQLMEHVLHAEPPNLRDLNRAVPRDLVTIVQKAIARDPRQRYARAADLAADLQRFLEDRPILARPVGTLEVMLKWVKRRPAVAALLALVMVVTLAGLGAFAWQFADALREKHNAQNEAHLKDIEAGLKAEALRQAEINAAEARQHATDAHEKEIIAHDKETTALKSLDDLKRTLFTAQLVRAGALAASDPEGALELLEDPDVCPPAMRDFSWAFYYGQCKRERWALPNQAGAADSFAVSADGKTIATHYDSGTITLWDLDTGKVRVALPGSWSKQLSSDRLFFLLSPDGKVLYTSGGHSLGLSLGAGAPGLERWDTATGKSLGGLLTNVAREAPPVLSPDGRWLAAVGMQQAKVGVLPDPGERGGRLKVWEVTEAGCRECAAIKLGDFTDSTKVKALALSADGQTVALAYEKMTSPTKFAYSQDIKLWDVATGKERLTLENNGQVTALMFSRDGKTFYVAGGGGVAHRDATTGDRLDPLEPAASNIEMLAVGADNKLLLGGSSSGAATVWDLQTGKVRTIFRSARAPLVLLPDGGALLSIGTDGAVHRWDLDPEAGRPLDKEQLSFDKVTGNPVRKMLTPDGKYQVLLPTGASLKLRDARTDKVYATINDLPRRHELQFSPDGKTTVVVINGGTVHFYDTKTGQDRGTFATSAGDLEFSPDGSFCVAETGTCTRDTGRYSDGGWVYTVEALKIWDVATGHEVATLKDAQGPVIFSKDGKSFAAVEGEPRDPKITTPPPRRTPLRVKVWETATGQERATIDMTVPVAFSPDGSTLLIHQSMVDAPIGSPRRPGKKPVLTVKQADLMLWDLATEQARFTLEDVDLHQWFPGQTKVVVDDTKSPVIGDALTGGPRQGVNVVFTPDGKLIATANRAGTVILWDAAHGTETLRLVGHTGAITSMAITADGKTLATSGEDRTIRLWDVATGRELHTLRGHTQAVLGLSFSADDKLLVARESTPLGSRLWDVASGREYLFRGGRSLCSTAALSLDGKIIATASGHEVHLWDAGSGDLLATLEGHTSPVTALAFSADGQTLTSESGVEVKEWNVATRKETVSRRVRTQSLSSYQVSPDGRTLMVREEDVLTLRDLMSGEARGRLEGVVGAPVFCPDGNRCAVEMRVPAAEGRSSSVVRLWDFAAGRELATLDGAQGAVVFSVDGKAVAGVVKGSALVLWDAATGRERGRVAGTWVPVILGPNGDTVLVQERDKALALWEPAAHKAPRALPKATLPAVFALDGKTLATGGPDCAVLLWDVADAKQVASLAGHERAVDDLVFAPDGRTVVSTSLDAEDSTLRLWDVAARRERASLKLPQNMAYGRTGQITAPLFTPDGKTVIWYVHGALLRLEVETGKEVPWPKDLPITYLSVLSSDGQTLAYWSGGSLSLVDVGTGKVRTVVETVPYGGSVRFTTDSKRIIHSAQANLGDSLKVFDAVTGKELVTYHPPSRLPSYYPGHPITLDSRLQVGQAQYNDPTLALSDPATGRQLGTLEVLADKRNGLPQQATLGLSAFSPDGKLVATADTGGAIVGFQIWDLADGTLPDQLYLRRQNGRVLSLRFSADGKKLFGLTFKELFSYDLATSKIETHALPQAFTQGASISRDGKLVAYATAEEVRLFDVDSGKVRTVAQVAHVTVVELAPDGRSLIVMGSADDKVAGLVRVLDVDSGKELLSVKTPYWAQRPGWSYSADGQTVAVQSAYNAIKVWNLATGKERATLATTAYGQAALSPDGKYIALATQQGPVSVRETATGKEVRAMPLPQYTQTALLQFSPDGKMLLVAPYNGRPYYFALWSPFSEDFRVFRGQAMPHSLAVSPDRKTLAVGGTAQSAIPLTVLDAETGREKHFGIWQLGNVVTAFSPDGKLLAFGGDHDPLIRLWDFEKQTLRKFPRGHTEGVVRLAFSPDGKFLASGGMDLTVRLWNVAEGKETGVLKGFKTRLLFLAFAADSKTLVSATFSHLELPAKTTVPGEVKVWDVATAKERSSFALDENLSCLAFNRDGSTLATAAPDGKIKLWDVLAGKERLTLSGAFNTTCMAFSPDGKTLVSSDNGRVRSWDWAAGVEQKDHFRTDLAFARYGVTTAVVFSADGKTLYLAGNFTQQPALNQVSCALWHFDAVTGQDLGPVGPEKSGASSATQANGTIVAAKLSKDGKTLAVAWLSQVEVWDLTTSPSSTVTGRLRHTFRVPYGLQLHHLALRADGKVVAAGGYQNNVYLWDALTGRQLAAPKPESGQYVGDMVFSPDGKLLAVTSGPTIRLFDAETGADKGQLEGYRANVVNLAFRADSSALLARTSDGEIKLWDLATSEELLTVLGRPTPLAIQGLDPDGKTVRTKELKNVLGEPSRYVIRRWDPATEQEVGQPEIMASSALVSPDQSVRIALEFDSNIRFVDPATSEERVRLSLNSALEGMQLVYSPDGKRVAVIGTESNAPVGGRKRAQSGESPTLVQVWDLTTTRLLASHRGIVAQNWSNQYGAVRPPLLVFSPEGRSVALVELDRPLSTGGVLYKGTLRVLDLATGEEKPIVKSPQLVTSLAFSADGKILATGDKDAVHFWDVASGKELRAVANHSGWYVHVVGFMMNDGMLALGLENPSNLYRGQKEIELQLWDLTTDQAGIPCKGARLPAAVSPDGRCVAAVGSQGTNWGGHVIQVWDAFTGQERAVLRGHRNQINNLSFTPDGQALISQGWDRALRWQAAWPDLAEQSYLEGITYLWKLQRKQQNFQPPNEQPYLALLPAAERFAKTLKLRSDHQGAYAGLVQVVASLNMVPAQDNGKIRSEVFALLRQVASTCQDRPESHYLLATSVEPDNTAEALEQYRQAIKCDAKHVEAHAHLAALLLRTGQLNEALTAYRELLKVQPDHEEANRRAAELLLQKGDVAGAVPLLRKLVEVKPEGRGCYLLARSLERLGQTDDAIAAYEKAAGFAGNNALQDLAHLLEHLNRWTDAAAAHRRRVASSPKNARYQSELAYALRRAGQMDESLAAYRRYQELGGGSWLHNPECWPDMEEKLPADPTGKIESTDGDELLTLANLCLFKLRTPTAARLYADAMAAQPKLIGERYNAACAAALAGTNADKEATALDEKDKAHWRQQALDWLREELEQQRKLLKGGPAERPWQIQEHLGYWRRDPDLFGVVDPARQTTWTEAERTAWIKFWADADELRRQALVLSGGRWRVEGDDLIQSARIKAPCWLRFGDPKWVDYDFEVEALREAGGHDGFGLGVRMADADNHCLINLGGWTNRFHGVEVTEDGQVVYASTTTAASIEADRWYKVRVLVRGDNINVYVDGVFVLRMWTPNHPNGGVGLRSWDTVNRFRNLKVTDPQGKVLFQGQPPLPVAEKP